MFTWVEIFVYFTNSLTWAFTHSDSLEVKLKHLFGGSELSFFIFLSSTVEISHLEYFLFFIFFGLQCARYDVKMWKKELESRNLKHGEHGDDTKPILWIFTNIRNVKLITDNMFFSFSMCLWGVRIGRDWSGTPEKFSQLDSTHSRNIFTKRRKNICYVYKFYQIFQAEIIQSNKLRINYLAFIAAVEGRQNP